MKLAQLRGLATTLSCAALDIAPSGTATGFVSTQADLLRVRQLASHAERVALRPWPQCEALLTLDRQISQANGLAMTLDKPARPCPAGTLCGGDALALTVHMPRWSGYLYVAYIQAAGDTLLLEQPAGAAIATRKPNEIVILGKGEGQPDLRISAPYGTEMIIAMASASPLFDTTLPDSMTEREFLTVLRKALIYKPRRSDPDRVVAAAVMPITTGAR